METIGYTFARLNGLAVVIHEDDMNNAGRIRVRYCGAKGKQIREEVFYVNRSELSGF
jgi:hypothetical protein